jgi:hypothetical protein
MSSNRTRVKIPALFVAAALAGAASFLGAQPSGAGQVKRSPIQGGPGHWEQRLTCELPVRPGARLVVRADVGSVVVKPAAGDRMECEVRVRVEARNETAARNLLEAYELTVKPLEGGGAFLAGRFPSERRSRFNRGAAFLVSVPKKFRLDLQTQGGPIKVESLEGELQAVTAGGNIYSGDISGPVRVETAGGAILLGQMGSRVEARTAGGSIRVGDVRGDAVLETSGGEIVTGRVGGTLSAETAGGDVVVRSGAGPIEARTAGGQIQIGDARAVVRAQTAGGSIRLFGSQGPVEVRTAGGSIDLFGLRSGVRAQTAAGRILAAFAGDARTFAACDLQTAVGDVRVYLPATLALTIDAAIDQAAGHRIISEFPLQILGEQGAIISRTLRGHGELNGGGEVLRIRTTMGNIEIRRLDARSSSELEQRREAFEKAWEEKEVRKLKPRE